MRPHFGCRVAIIVTVLKRFKLNWWFRFGIKKEISSGFFSLSFYIYVTHSMVRAALRWLSLHTSVRSNSRSIVKCGPAFLFVQSLLNYLISIFIKHDLVGLHSTMAGLAANMAKKATEATADYARMVMVRFNMNNILRYERFRSLYAERSETIISIGNVTLKCQFGGFAGSMRFWRCMFCVKYGRVVILCNRINGIYPFVSQIDL